MFLSLLHVNVGNDPGRRWLRDIYRVHQRLWMGFPDAKRRAEDPFFLDAWEKPAACASKPTRSESGFLFRIERDQSPRILVQSVRSPDWKYAFQNAPYLLDGDPQIRQFDPTPHGDQIYRFRLLANVVKRKSVVHPNGKMRTTSAGLTIARRRRAEILVHPEPMPDPLPGDPLESKRLLLARWDPWRKWLDHVASARGFRVIDEPTSPLSMEAVHALVHNPGKGRGGSDQEGPTDRRYNAGLFNGVLICTDPDRLRATLIHGIGPAKAFGFGLLSLAPAPGSSGSSALPVR